MLRVTRRLGRTGILRPLGVWFAPLDPSTGAAPRGGDAGPCSSSSVGEGACAPARGGVRCAHALAWERPMDMEVQKRRPSQDGELAVT